MLDTTFPVDLLAVTQEELTRTVYEFPYSSCTPLLRAFASESLDPRFGDVCVQQLFRTTDQIFRRTGVEFTFLRDGRHLTGVTEIGDYLLVLDPYLSHIIPIVIPLEGEGPVQTVKVPAAPRVEDRNGRTHLSFVHTKLDSNTGDLSISQVKWSSRTDEFRVSRSFRTNRTRIVDRALTEIDYRPLLFHPEQNNLSVRVVDPVTAQYLEVKTLIEGEFQPSPYINSVLVEKENEQAFWNRITALLGADRFEVIEYIAKAYKVFHSHRESWSLKQYD